MVTISKRRGIGTAVCTPYLAGVPHYLLEVLYQITTSPNAGK
jgi:hypothetical protein